MQQRLVTTEEICNYAGITKRALQCYLKMGLVEPVKASHAGNLYQGGTEGFVCLIRLLSETGYELKDIKPIIYSKDFNISVPLKRSQLFLEKRIRRDKALYQVILLFTGAYEEFERINNNRTHSLYFNDNLREPFSTPKELFEGTNDLITMFEELIEMEDDYELYGDPEGIGRLFGRIACISLMMGENIESEDMLNTCRMIFKFDFSSDFDNYLAISLLGAFVDSMIDDFVAANDTQTVEEIDLDLISELKEEYRRYYSEFLRPDRFKYTSIVLTNYYEKYLKGEVEGG